LTRPLHCSLPLRTNRNSQCEGGVIIKICTFAFVQVGCRVLFHNSQQSQVDKTRDSHHCVFPLAFTERSSEALGFAEASEGMGNDVHRHVVLPSDERDWWDDGYYLIGCRESFPPFSHSAFQCLTFPRNKTILDDTLRPTEKVPTLLGQIAPTNSWHSWGSIRR
jgi:hypothetical protein